MENKNARFIAIIVLIGIVVTITIGIFALVYTNHEDVQRDEYYAAHCSGKVITNTYGETTAVNYTCAESK